MIRLGRGKEDLFHPLPHQKSAEKAVPPRSKRPEDIAKRLAQILHRARPLVDSAERVDQHHLPVDPGEVVAKEGLRHLRFIGVIAPLHLAPEAAPGGAILGAKRSKGQGGRAGHLTGQQESSRRQVGIARQSRALQIAGIGARQCLGVGFLPRPLVAKPLDHAEKARRLVARRDPVQHLARPFGVGAIHQPEVEQPFPGIIHDVEMHDSRPLQSAEQPAGTHLERQAQLAHRARAFGPMRAGRGQRGEVTLVLEPGHGVVGLGLKEGGGDPSVRLRDEARHARPVQEVCNQRGDEHRLARPRQPGHAEPDDRLKERARDRIAHRFHLPGDALGQPANHQSSKPRPVFISPQEWPRPQMVL